MKKQSELEAKITLIVGFIMLIGIFALFPPLRIFLPLIIGMVIMETVDSACKKAWGAHQRERQ